MSGSLNRVQLLGRLGRDPELRYTGNGTPVANFSLATDESYTDQQGQKQQRAEWHKIVCWGRLAENVSANLAKGRLVLVEGSLQTRKFQDQQGQDRTITEVVARNVQFLPSGSGGGQQQGQAQQEQGLEAQQGGDDDAPF